MRARHAESRRATTLLVIVMSGTILSLSQCVGSDVTPCPRGCRCVRGDGGDVRLDGRCTVEVTCKTKRDFPDLASTPLPPSADCLLVSAREAVERSIEEKERLLSAIPPGVRSLNFEFASLGSGDGLPPTAFGRFTRLRALLLEFGQLRTLPPDAFSGARQIRTLWLTGNHIERGEPGYRRGWRHANQLTSVPPQLFRGLSQLRVLLMHHNRLTELPAGLFADTPRLTVLKLLDNDMARLSPRHPAVAPLLRPQLLPKCARGHPSDGSCLQLDLRIDSGDLLEDLWEAYGVALGSEDAVDGVIGRTLPRHGNDKDVGDGLDAERKRDLDDSTEETGVVGGSRHDL